MVKPKNGIDRALSKRREILATKISAVFDDLPPRFRTNELVERIQEKQIYPVYLQVAGVLRTYFRCELVGIGANKAWKKPTAEALPC